MTVQEKEMVIEILEMRIIDTELEIEIINDRINIEVKNPLVSENVLATLGASKMAYSHMLLKLKKDLKRIKSLID